MVSVSGGEMRRGEGLLNGVHVGCSPMHLATISSLVPHIKESNAVSFNGQGGLRS